MTGSHRGLARLAQRRAVFDKKHDAVGIDDPVTKLERLRQAAIKAQKVFPLTPALALAGQFRKDNPKNATISALMRLLSARLCGD